jgi:hypothetical protein
MDRIYNILNQITEAAQKTYKGIKRSDLKDSDFLFPETRSFPVVTPQDIPDAISNFGRMKNKMNYDEFLNKLYKMAKRKGKEFVNAIPDESKQKLGIKSKSYYDVDTDDMMEDEDYDTDVTQLYTEMLGKKLELDALKKLLTNMKKSKGEDFTQVENMEEETIEQELMEYKNDFFEMSLGSIKAIATHAQNILNSISEPAVKENLTESWLQGKIAITEDYMRTIHDFVMFVTENDDESDAGSKPGLWENIRRKKEKMGKNYKPAKRGEKDRPDPEQWKKLTKDSKK